MDILSVRVDNITYQDALEAAKNLIDAGGKHYIVTPNPEIIVRAQKDKEFRRILNQSSLSIPDGVGVVWAAKILGQPLSERVAGVDFLEGLAALAAEHGYSLFLLGGGEGVAEGVSKKFKAQSSKFKIDTAAGPVLNQDGKPVNNEETEKEKEVIEKINQFRPDILIVGFGAPKQEKWIARNLPKLNVKLAIGVGGALDYISGEKPRAPTWVQKIGLEWFFRLITEPARFKRQSALPYFGYLVLTERLKK